MNLLIIGDLHGHFDIFNRLLKKEKSVKFDAIIILGDVGIWHDTIHKYNKSITSLTRHKIYFIRGNHEEYSYRDHSNWDTIKPYMNDYYGAVVSELIKPKHIPIYINDEIIDIGGRTFLGVGGADSIDKCYRIEGISWWKEEAINKQSIETIIKNDNKNIEVILTHDAPAKILIDMGSKELDLLYEKIRPRLWLFGHHHEYSFHEDTNTGTKFYGFPKFNELFAILDTDTMNLNFGYWHKDEVG